MKRISLAAFMSFAFMAQAGSNSVLLGNGVTVAGNGNRVGGNYGNSSPQKGDNSVIIGNGQVISSKHPDHSIV